MFANHQYRVGIWLQPPLSRTGLRRSRTAETGCRSRPG